jgi:hypothetical protein
MDEEMLQRTINELMVNQQDDEEEADDGEAEDRQGSGR